MGSQVRILYRPPSKEQVRGVKPLAFFFLTPRVTPKVTPKTESKFSETLFLSALHLLTLSFVLHKTPAFFRWIYSHRSTANVKTGTTRTWLTPAGSHRSPIVHHNPSSFWPASGQLPVLTRMKPPGIISLPATARPAAKTKGGPHGRDRMRKLRIPLLALPTPGARPLPTTSKLRRRLASPSPSPLCDRYPQSTNHYRRIDAK